MLRSSARRAAGNGPNGPSFDASLTTRSRPSSRWTSSTGFPGSYGTRSAIERRKKLSSTSATRLGTPTAYALLGRRLGPSAAADEPERAPRSADQRGVERLVRPLRLAVDARDGGLRLPLRNPLADLQDDPAEHGVTPVHDSHRRLLPSPAAVVNRALPLLQLLAVSASAPVDEIPR